MAEKYRERQSFMDALINREEWVMDKQTHTFHLKNLPAPQNEKNAESETQVSDR